jgi:hypothetical protein
MSHLEPSPRHRTCDLQATRDDEQLLIEVKSWQLPPETRAAIERGEPVQVGGDVSWRAKDSKKLGAAGQQTRAVAERDGLTALQAIWACVAMSGETHSLQTVFSTLYGVRFYRIVSGPCRNGVNIIPVYCADRPLFAELTHIAAVVVNPWARLGMWLNPFSPHVQAFLRTRLFGVINRHRVVFHLPLYREPASLYVADPAAVEKSLQRDYGISVKPCPPREVRAVSTVHPGSEMGSSPALPGAELHVGIVDVLAQLEKEAAERV